MPVMFYSVFVCVPVCLLQTSHRAYTNRIVIKISLFLSPSTFYQHRWFARRYQIRQNNAK